MRKSKIIKWQEREVTVKELTVEEITRLIESEARIETLDLIFGERVPVAAVELSTGLKRTSFNGLAPSSLEPLWDTVEEVNPFFLQTLRRLADLGSAALQQAGTTK